MASSLISGAVALLLILTGGYIMASGILSIGEIISLTQTDMTMTQEKIRQTNLNITSSDWTSPTVTISVLNTGLTSFPRDDAGFDLYLCDDSNVTRKATIQTRSIPDDITGKEMWDPSETLVLTCNPGYTPTWVRFVTSNGISASTNL